MYSCYTDVAVNAENDNYWLSPPIFYNKPYLPPSSHKYDSVALKQYETAIKLYLPYASLSPTAGLSAGIQAAPGCRYRRCALTHPSPRTVHPPAFRSALAAVYCRRTAMQSILLHQQRHATANVAVRNGLSCARVRYVPSPSHCSRSPLLPSD